MQRSVSALVSIGVLILGGCAESEQSTPKTYLERYADAVRQRGERAATVPVLVEYLEPAGLRAARQSASIMLVTFQGEPSTQIVGDSDIVTWYILRLDETLSTPDSPASFACGGNGRSLPLLPIAPGTIALAAYGGTTVIADVELTITDSEWHFSPESGVEYLIFAQECDDSGKYVSPFGLARGVFEVKNDETILPPRGGSALAADLRRLGTVQKLREGLAGIASRAAR